MTEEYDDEEDPKPTKVGRCCYHVGGLTPLGCGNAIFSDDFEAIDLGNIGSKRVGMICAKCLDRLFNSRPWSAGPGHEAQREAGQQARQRGHDIVLPGSISATRPAPRPRESWQPPPKRGETHRGIAALEVGDCFMVPHGDSVSPNAHTYAHRMKMRITTKKIMAEGEQAMIRITRTK